MGITIDANMYLLCSMFNISRKKLANEYSNLTVEEIMKAEAEQGNTAAANFDKSVLSDPTKLIELFELKDPGNKFAILRNMNEHDLDEILPLLSPEDLAAGLNFFTKDKLLALTNNLPIEQLVKMTFEMFSPEQLMQFMPEEQLNKALSSQDMDKSLEIKYLQSLKPEIMAQMLESVTGQPVSGADDIGLDGQANLDKAVLYNQLIELPDDKFQEALLNIPTQNKREFILKMSKENPKIFEMFEADAYTNIINQRKEKKDIVKAAHVLEPKFLVGMITQLPQELTAAVLTQIDTKKFAEILMTSFKDILSKIVAA